MENRHDGPLGYVQGPILQSFIAKLQKQRQLSAEKPRFCAPVTKQSRPPESYSSVENGRKYYLRKYYFYISMEILLGENGQLGAFPDLLFEYFQINCPWKY